MANPDTEIKNHSKKNQSLPLGLLRLVFRCMRAWHAGAQCDQVLFHVTARLAAEFEVMHLQMLHATANLASPAVAFQDLPM